MEREPLDWENAPQSSGLTFEGAVDRLRFAASTPKSGARHQTRITLGFRLTLIVGAIALIALAFLVTNR
ncbi:MAG: hypothetical protein ACO3C1_08640 [Ilumatobacteraceae bacterium]